MSNKFMGKLGKFTNSVSRFFSGDDVQEEKRQAKDPLAGALEEIHALKDIFFRTPSKARVRPLGCSCGCRIASLTHLVALA